MFTAILAASSLTAVAFASAQSMPKPSVPIFSLTFTDHSFDAPAATIMSGYTGPTYVPAHHSRNGTIEITILNQPFTPYKDEMNHTIKLYYHYACKGHYENDWIIYPDVVPDIAYNEASDSEKTTFQYWINEEWENDPAGRVPDVPDDGQMDVRVEAFIGYSETICTSIARRADDYHTYYVGQSSGWSCTQTITIGSGSSSSLPNLQRPPVSSYPDNPQTTPETPAPPSSTDQTTEPSPSETMQPSLGYTLQTLLSGIIIGAGITIFLASAALLIYSNIRRH